LTLAENVTLRNDRCQQGECGYMNLGEKGRLSIMEMKTRKYETQIMGVIELKGQEI